MEIFQIIVFLATFLCSLVAGFLFAFAIVVMPGIRNLYDRDFIRAFQVMDGVIQNNQPIFVLVWVGSVAALVASLVLGIWQLDGARRLLIIVAAAAYLLGVQLPTFAVNIPLNNKLLALDIDAVNAAVEKTARQEFEARWNLWNAIRTAFACLTSALLILLLSRF